MLSNDVQCNAQHFFMLILEKKTEKKNARKWSVSLNILIPTEVIHWGSITHFLVTSDTRHTLQDFALFQLFI